MAHALLSRGAKDFDSKKAVSLAVRLADNVYEAAPQEVPQTVISTRSRKKITDKSELRFPYTSDAFMSAWRDLTQCSKWKKKDAKCLQYSLDKLAKYEEEFAIQLMSNAIAGGYQGIEFESTPALYRRWLAERGSGIFFGQTPQAKAPRQASKIERNAMAAAEAARLILGNDNDLSNGADDQ